MGERAHRIALRRSVAAHSPPGQQLQPLVHGPYQALEHAVALTQRVASEHAFRQVAPLVTGSEDHVEHDKALAQERGSRGETER